MDDGLLLEEEGRGDWLAVEAISKDKRSTILKFGTHCAEYKYTSALD